MRYAAMSSLPETFEHVTDLSLDRAWMKRKMKEEEEVAVPVAVPLPSFVCTTVKVAQEQQEVP